MFKNLLIATVLFAIASSLALAADIDGKWTADVPGRGGNTVTQTLTLKSSGNALTGTLEGGRGRAVDISSGVIDGSNVSFRVVREFNGNEFTQQYKGTLSGSGELTLTVTGGGGRGGGKRGGNGGSREVVFKRAG